MDAIRFRCEHLATLIDNLPNSTEEEVEPPTVPASLTFDRLD